MTGSLRKAAGLIALLLVIAYPMIPGLNDSIEGVAGKKIGGVFPTIFIYGILALALNVVVGYTGLLHLGIAAFFGIGAFTTGILTVGQYPFQLGFFPSLVISTFAAAILGAVLCVPTLRLRGDYLALVTLGFGLLTVTALRNLQEITGGMQTLNPIPAPKIPSWLESPLRGIGLTLSWTEDYRLFYYLTLAYLLIVFWFLRNLERSSLGRSWIALREDELAATCMGINAARLKLLAFTLAAGLAGLAGSLYATNTTTTTEPTRFDFQLSCTILSCLILGGLGNRTGVLLGVFLVAGYDFLFAPSADAWLQRHEFVSSEKGYLKFSSWNLMIFGLSLILMMRYRSSGLLPQYRDGRTAKSGKGA